MVVLFVVVGRVAVVVKTAIRHFAQVLVFLAPLDLGHWCLIWSWSPSRREKPLLEVTGVRGRVRWDSPELRGQTRSKEDKPAQVV